MIIRIHTKWSHTHDELFRTQTNIRLMWSKFPETVSLEIPGPIQPTPNLKLPAMEKYILHSIFCTHKQNWVKRGREKTLTVKVSMNSQEPRYPPKIVFNCADASHGRYICIVENNMTASIDDSANETPLDTAANVRIWNQIRKVCDITSKPTNWYRSHRHNV